MDNQHLRKEPTLKRAEARLKPAEARAPERGISAASTQDESRHVGLFMRAYIGLVPRGVFPFGARTSVRINSRKFGGHAD
jgi:hypothetical protein